MSSSVNPRIVDGRRADAHAGGDRRRALVERHGVAVDGDGDLGQPLLGVLAAPLRRAQVELEQVDVGAAREQPLAAVHERRGERLGVGDDPALVLAERLGRRELEAHRLRRRRCGTAARPAGPGTRPCRPPRRAPPCTARGPTRGPASVLCVVDVTDVGVLDRVRVQAGGDEPREVRHVDHQPRADVVGDRPERGRRRSPAGRPSAPATISRGRCWRASRSTSSKSISESSRRTP